jgi:long-chain acyl-CoA synthetase
MKYTAHDKDEHGNPTPRGEILARGPQVFQGYYKRPDLNAETVVDGWLHTGDVAVITPNLTFKIIDRKKNIFKLSQGEYVAPDVVESVYLKSGLIEEMFLTGDSKRSHTVAIIAPKREKAEELARWLGLEGPIELWINKTELRTAYLKELNEYARKLGLAGFMVAKNVYFELGGFAARGILTNTMKLIRYAGREVF